MRNHRVILAGLIIAALTLAFANNAAAVTHTIGTGDTFEKTYNADAGDIASMTWWADGVLSFTVEDPSGTIVHTYTGTSDSYTPFFADEGQYTFIWENTGVGAVVLEYTVIGFGELQQAWNTFILIAVIGVIAVIAIVVLLVVLLLMKGKKKAAVPPAPVGPAVIDGKCTKCGSPVEPGVAFCPKCGAPLR